MEVRERGSLKKPCTAGPIAVSEKAEEQGGTSSGGGTVPVAEKKVTCACQLLVGAKLQETNEDEEQSLSEMSSGMIVCDLSNEFRKLKVTAFWAAEKIRNFEVKRRHHPSASLPSAGGVTASRRAR